MKNKIIIDSSFLVGLFDEKDKRYNLVSSIMEELQFRGVEAIYFDFVINEVISVICKRFEERERLEEVKEVILKIKDAKRILEANKNSYFLQNLRVIIII